MTLLWVVAIIIVLGALAYQRASLIVWTIAMIVGMVLITELSPFGVTAKLVLWLLVILTALLNFPQLRKNYISKQLLTFFRKVMPKMSEIKHKQKISAPSIPNPTMNTLIKKLREFATARDWDQYHSPKNLIMALSVKVAEIMEILQWLTEEESRNLDQKTLAKIKDEIGDVQIYLARLADQLGFSPLDAALEKLKKNALKYPPEKAKGSAKKYTDFDK